MKIDQIELYHLKLPLVTPFTTSFARFEEKDTIIVKILSDGLVGYGESACLGAPFYNEETVGTCLHIQEDFIAPKIIGKEISNINQLVESYSWIRKNNFAKAGIEMAVYDLFAKSINVPLYQFLGGSKDEITSGVSIGLKDSMPELIDFVSQCVEKNFHRYKIKIKPGKDIDLVDAIRKEFPEIPLMVDANSAYSLNDIALIKEFDQYNLLMIEQPLGYDDIVDHGELNKHINTPLCLDESIHSLDDLRKAISLGSIDILNIKPGRVGGVYYAIKMHDYAKEKGIPVWCGGMLETGIGRAHNLAISTLDNFTITGDIGPTKNYYEHDIIDPEIIINPSGKIELSNLPGIGYDIDNDKLADYSVKKVVIKS